MSSMKRRIFMGKAKSVKSNVLKIVSIVAADISGSRYNSCICSTIDTCKEGR